jgi:hypothetical protein
MRRRTPPSPPIFRPALLPLIFLFVAAAAAASPFDPHPPPSAAVAVDLFVSPAGKDDPAGCGTDSQSPCLTIQGALRINDEVDVSVTLAPGVYAPPPDGINLSGKSVRLQCSQPPTKTSMPCAVDCSRRGPFVAAAAATILKISSLSIANCVSAAAASGGAINAGALLCSALLAGG